MGVKGARIHIQDSQIAILAKECPCVNTIKYIMLIIKKLMLNDASYPAELQQIASPPKQLFLTGADLANILYRPRLAVVGSRKVSAYGREVTQTLTRQLSEQGIVIISGLAFGVDAIAHKAALETNGITVAVLPGPLEQIRPSSNRQLADNITAKGGALVTEYPVDTPALRQHFVARNRLVAGLAQAVLITEAAEKSGSLHTARFALEQGKDVLAVPGPINSPTSIGVNNLIKAGATPVTDYRDVLYALGLEVHESSLKTVKGSTQDEQRILDLMLSGHYDGSRLLIDSGLSISNFNQVMAMLEINGKIRPLGTNHWAIY